MWTEGGTLETGSGCPRESGAEAPLRARVVGSLLHHLVHLRVVCYLRLLQNICYMVMGLQMLTESQHPNLPSAKTNRSILTKGCTLLIDSLFSRKTQRRSNHDSVPTLPPHGD